MHRDISSNLFASIFMTFFLNYQIRILPIFFELVLKSLFIGHGFITVQYRRRVQLIIRKSRLVKQVGRRDLRLFFVKRFSRLCSLAHLYAKFYSRRISIFSRTRRSGMCLSIRKRFNPFFATYILRNKLAGEHIDFKLFVFSQTTFFLLRLEIPIIILNLQSKPFYFIPNLSRHPSFEELQ